MEVDKLVESGFWYKEIEHIGELNYSCWYRPAKNENMGMPKHKGSTDKNHKEIITEANAIGAGVIDCRKWPIGFDALMFYRGKIFVVEIKTPKSIPKNGNRSKALTPNESRAQEFCQKYKVPYNIIISPKEIRDMLTELAGFAWEPLKDIPVNRNIR